MPLTVLSKNATRRGIVFQWWWLIWVAAAACVFVCGAALGVVSGTGAGGGGGWFGALFRPPFGGRDQINILAVGADNTTGKGLGDTLMVATVRPGNGEIGVISIPRDSRVEIPGVGIRRINAAHSTGGLPLTRQTIEQMLGIQIDYYIEIDVPGIVKLVDALEGIDIEIEKRMYYRDRSQDLTIDLTPGMQHLNGLQAMGYVRFRHDAMGDLGRMERQRKFLRAVVHRLLGPENITKLPKLAEVFVSTVDTNLTVTDLLSLKKIVEQSGPDGMRMATLPGTPVMVHHQSMIELDPQGVQQTLNRVLWRQGVTVEVLNGTNINGLASQTASKLEEFGCEIIEVKNAEEKTDTTLVIDHRGQTRRAERLSEWLGRGVVSAAPDQANPADVTVIVGRDMVGI